MIAIGRDQDVVVIIGTPVGGTMVEIRITEEEAGSLLRQLSAILHKDEPALLHPEALRQFERMRPAPSLIVTDLGDPAAEARERDAAALAAQGGPGPARPGRAPTRSAEDLERQEARRQRLRGAGNGTVEGPVDE